MNQLAAAPAFFLTQNILLPSNGASSPDMAAGLADALDRAG